MNHTFEKQLGNPTNYTAVWYVTSGQDIKKHPWYALCSKLDQQYLIDTLNDFKADALSDRVIMLPEKSFKHVILIGLGEKGSLPVRKVPLAVRKALVIARARKMDNLVFLVDDVKVKSLTIEKVTEVISCNVEMANYEFVTYKEEPKDGWSFVKEVSYITKDAANAKLVAKGIQTGSVIGQQTSFTRDLSNTPGGDMTPTVLANEAVRVGKEYGVVVKVLGENEMKELKMGGILGVSKGSTEEAKLIVMEYFGGKKSQKPLMFVGKGITFDSGGLHIKPGSSMDEMHMDMSGAASVISAVTAIARLKLKVNVVGIAPAAENMPSGESYRPGDLLKSMLGKTIEVVSPDAEGRVVLADALTYGTRYEPSLVVDLATLTGACVVALGHHAVAVLSPDEKLARTICEHGEESGDYAWPLPMWEEYESGIKGTFGDILNAEKVRGAGTINGAMFLYQFAKQFPAWAHVDIASMMTTTPDQFLAKGASGVGTRMLVEIARNAS